MRVSAATIFGDSIRQTASMARCVSVPGPVIRSEHHITTAIAAATDMSCPAFAGV